MVEKQQTKDEVDNSKKEESSSGHIVKGREFRQRTPNKTWSGLLDRYKNLWRVKKRDSEFKKGIMTVFTTVLISAILSGLISSATMSYLVIPSGIVLSTVGGVILSSTTYDMDSFTNAHIGFLLGIFILGYQMSGVMVSGNPYSTSIIASVVSSLLNVVGLTVAMIGYGHIGEWLKSVTKETYTAN